MKSLPDRDVSAHTEIGWVEDLISGWVGKDSLGVNTGLVGECTESSNVVVATCQLGFPSLREWELTKEQRSRRPRRRGSRFLGAWEDCTWT
jgi:hypothetical protein